MTISPDHGASAVRNTYDIREPLDENQKRLAAFDRIEIDCRDRHSFTRLNYLDRMNAISGIVKRAYNAPAGIRIGDFAAAQGNMGLKLAEDGYQVFSFDINPSYIAYSKMKYEKGDITWLAGNIETLDFPRGSLDVAIAGEIVEHCAYPEDILARILEFVKPGGILIVTTPNGARILNPLPTFGEVAGKDDRRVFVSRQFRPAGEDHLFLFKLDELAMIVPDNMEIIQKGYMGGTVLYNKLNQVIFRLLPVRLLERIISLSASIPLVNSRTCHNIYTVLRKKQ
jgi:2-polyprenyl-3-methyl-5-hydroxy-6-metoxy-1,4-benzoquinol methylase